MNDPVRLQREAWLRDVLHLIPHENVILDLLMPIQGISVLEFLELEYWLIATGFAFSISLRYSF